MNFCIQLYIQEHIFWGSNAGQSSKITLFLILSFLVISLLSQIFSGDLVPISRHQIFLSLLFTKELSYYPGESVDIKIMLLTY